MVGRALVAIHSSGWLRCICTVASPEELTADFRRVLLELAEDPTVALPDLRCADDVSKWSLYSARHGEIMHLLVSGMAVEVVAEMSRIPVSTLLRHYRRHNLSDDTLERNGAFSEIQLKVVLAHAQEQGFLATAASMEGLVRRVQQLDAGVASGTFFRSASG